MSQRFLRIGAVAEILGVSVRAVRLWTEKGLVRSAASTLGGGHRLYDPADVEEARQRMLERRPPRADDRPD